MNRALLEDLLERYIDRRLTEADRAQLERELLASREARQLFWQRLGFEGLLVETIDSQQVRQWLTEHEGAAIAPEAHRRRPTTWRQVLLFASIGLAAGFLLAFVLQPAPSARAALEPTSDAVALLTASAQVRWSKQQTPLEPGTVVSPGRLRIEAGLLGLEFYSGAWMTVEGPADIDVTGVDRVVCRQGKIRVRVSERARGFKVSTPKVDLVDLGTEFGVEIGPENRTELHVFDGSVELAQSPHTAMPGLSRELVSGQGLRIEGNAVTPISAQPDQFPSQQELTKLSREQVRQRYAAWREASQKLRTDPRVVLYYDFQPTGAEESALHNEAALYGRALDGAVVGAEWVDGRWSGKKALEFREPSDRVRLHIPGEYDALTLVAWLRADAFQNIYAGILLTDGFNPGTVHWQFHNGTMRVGIAGDTPDAAGRIGTEYDVTSVGPAVMLGRWRQVAIVIDTVKREVVHYLDGLPVQRAALLKPRRLALGKAELGNWGLPDKTGHQPIRNFNGRMDEFILFNQALSDQEIAALFEQGRVWPATKDGRTAAAP